MTVERLLLEVLERGVQLWTDGLDLRFKAPEGALTPDLRRRLRRYKARLVDRLGTGRRYAPASFDQRRLWIVDRMQPSGSAYSTAGAFRIRGRLDVTALEAALREIRRRHESLRTTLAAVDGQPMQVIAEALEAGSTAVLRVVDLTSVPIAAESVAVSRLVTESRRAFDLESGPLFRALLLRLDAGDWMLLLRLHHAVSDGWSDGLLYRELSELYSSSNGRPSPLLELPAQYADFAVWQRRRLGESLEDLRGYWRRQLAGLEPLQLPCDRPRPARPGFAGRAHRLRFDPELGAALERRAREAGASLYMILLAAFMALLHRLTGQRDFAVGSPITHRQREELEELIGFFVNMVTLRADLTGDPRFSEHLRRVRETALQAWAHQDLPFDRLVAEQAPDRDLARHPLFQVSCAVHNSPRVDLELAGLAVRRQHLPISTVHLDLELHLWPAKGGLEGYLVYASDLFRATTVARWAHHLGVLLTSIAGDPRLRLDQLPLHPRAQQHQLLGEWNDTRQRFWPTRPASETRSAFPAAEELAAHTPSAKSSTHPAGAPGDLLHQLFESQTARTPERAALVWRGASGRPATLSYRRLDRQAERLARRLRNLGLGPDDRAAILFDRGPERVVAMLGILKAGAAYLPLDPANPERRLAYLLADSRATVVVTSSSLRARAAAAISRLSSRRPRIVCLEPGGRSVAVPDPRGVSLQSPGQAQRSPGSSGAPSSGPERATHPAAPSSRCHVASGNVAYVLYTSGSTGRPKGTEISHAAICNHMHWMQAALPLKRRDLVVQKTPFSFDASVWEFWAPLQVGATLVLSPPGSHRDPSELLDLVRTQQVTILQVVPSLLRVLLDDPGWPHCSSLRRVLCGGEALAAELRERFAELRTGGELYNVYGPTEATIHATTRACGRASASATTGEDTIAIGRPIANAQALVVDRRLRPVVPGGAGELLIGGAGLARGYLDRPRLTAERFVPNPFAGHAGSPAGERLYRTGDLARHQPDGVLSFLGRVDHQVKVRGFRIEPGEIEARLLRHPAVRNAAVIPLAASGRPGIYDRLVAYVVPRAPRDRPSSRDLRAFLSRSLAEHMLPSAYPMLEALPLSTAGKVDRGALARRAPPSIDRRRASQDPPRTPIEELIAAIWAPLLRLERVGVHNHFFELGGHSLLAIQALSRIRRDAGVELAVATMFERPTIAELATAVEQALLDRALGLGPDLGEDEPPIVGGDRGRGLLLSFPQRGLWFLHQLEPASSAYHSPSAFQLSGRLQPSAVEAGLREIVRRHEALRTAFSSTGGRPRQLIRAVPVTLLPVIDLAGLESDRRQDAARRLASREATRPFDLSHGPLFRARLLRLADEEHLLLLCVHHIVFDGWSHGILCRELSALYRAATEAPGRRKISPLPELSVQYADFAAWQRRRLTGDALERRLAYWREQLAEPTLLQLPADRPPPANREATRAATRELVLEPELVDALAALAADRGTSLYMALLAAFALLLYRLTGQRDVIVGSPVAGRGREEIEGLIGFFVNMLALRIRVGGGDPSFARVLAEVRETALAAYAHQDLPFELVVEALAPDRDPERHPLFQVTLALHNAWADELDLPAVTARRMRLDTAGVRFDLELHFWPESGALRGLLVYDPVRFDAATVDRWSDHFVRLLQAAVDEPELLVALPPASSTRAETTELPEPAAGEPGVEPRTPAEKTLAEIWARVLGLEQVGVLDNFFELGGHSLLATRVRSRIRQTFGRDLPLRALFEQPTVAELAKRLEALPDGQTDAREPPASRQVARDRERFGLVRRPESKRGMPATIPPAARDRDLPLSFAQQRLWFLHRLEPASPAYHMPMAWRLAGTLDVDSLAQALGEIVRRHEILRTTFSGPGGRPYQHIEPATALPLPLIDLTAVPEAECEALRQTSAEALRPFVLERDPALRPLLIRLGATDHVLFLGSHHIASDGWSREIFERELSVLYEASATGEPDRRLPELTVQYADFAIWQRQGLRGEVLEAELTYWRLQLADLPVLELATDRPRHGRGGGRRAVRGADLAFCVQPEVARGLRRLSRSAGVSLYMTLLAAFMTLLHRLTGQHDLAVGTPIANRHRRELEDLIGFFVNTLVLRGDLSAPPDGLGFRRLLGRVKALCLDAYEHQDLPFEKLVEALDPERDLDRSPLFQVMFVMQNAPGTGLRLAGLAVSPFGLEASDPHFDLTVSILESGDELAGHLSYDASLFDRTTAARLARHYQTLLGGVVERPAQHLARLPLLDAGQRHQLLVEWSDTERRFAAPLPIHELVARRAAEVLEAIAVTYRQSHITFRQLDRRANRLAHHLRARGVMAETRVGVYLERSPELIVALLAILKAGGAYLPVDLTYPAARRRFMIRDAGVRHVVTTGDRSGELSPEVDHPILLDRERPAIARRPAKAPASAVRGDQLAYCLYTSGSTGQPKAVLVHHRGLANYLRWAEEAYRVAAGRGAPVISPVGFDLTVTSLYTPLMAGRTVTLLDDDPGLEALGDALTRGHYSFVKLTPAHLQALGSRRRTPVGTPGSIVLGGEALRWDQLTVWRAASPVVNEYGPTETVVGCSAYRAASQTPRSGPVPIGRPIANTRLRVLDRHLRPVPPGIFGELCVGGAGVTRGYLDRPGLTAKAYLPDSWAPEPGRRLYRTGDRARLLADGHLEYLDRLDHQVKVRGFRVEPGEIEAALRRHPAIGEAVVVAAPEGHRLVAYLTGPDGDRTEPPNDRRLRRFLRRDLPEPMLPSVFVRLPRLPRSASGKIDRGALPAPEVRPAIDSPPAPPRTPLEDMLATIWADVLGLSEVGTRDNFFELGGHSLLATQLMSRIRRSFGTELPLRELFERPTIARLARSLERALEIGTGPAPPIVPVGRDRPLPLSFAQQRLWFLHRYEPASPAYNMPAAWQVEGDLDVAALERALGEIERRHEILRTTYPAAGGRPRQHISPTGASHLPLIDLTALPPPARRAEARQRLAAEVARPFDLASEQPLRALLVRLTVDRHALFVNTHHIASDGWSQGIFNRELSALYQVFAGARGGQRPSPLPEPALQFSDFAAWQRAWLRGEVLERQLAYWRRQLADLPALELATDRPRPAVLTHGGAAVDLQLSAEHTAALKRRSLEAGTSLYMSLLAVFMTLLHRLTGQPEVVVGTPIANRHRREVEDLIGVFVNTLVLRGDLSGRPSFDRLLDRVKTLCLEAYDHQDVPFEKLVEELNPERDLARSALFQVMFILHNAPGTAPVLRGLEISDFDLGPTRTRFDLTVSLYETRRRLAGQLAYNADLYDRTTILRLARSFETLLAWVAAARDPADLPLLEVAQRHQAVVEWNDARGRVAGGCLHRLFEAQVRRTPDAVAIVAGGLRLSYRELDRRAGQLAGQLRALGVSPDDPVGLLLDRSVAAIVGLLAVLEAGGAYVPLDVDSPPDRLAFQLADSRIGVLLARDPLSAGLPEGLQILRLDRRGRGQTVPSPPIHASNVRPAPRDAARSPAPNNAAYVIYTSGSSGRPKGVVVEHRQIASYVSATAARFELESAAGLSFALLQPLRVDSSMTTVFGALLTGGCLHVFSRMTSLDPRTVAASFQRRRIDVLKIAPSHLAALEDAAGEPTAPRRELIVGGEAWGIDQATRWRRLATRRIWNHYGPTEATVGTHVYRMGRHLPPILPIGRPLANSEGYLVDERFRPVPLRAPGELVLGGDCLARGYLGRPALTALSFVPHPFAGAPGRRLYKTGDLARHHSRGDVELLGRRDHQLKIRGFRIEPGEIEAALRSHPDVREAAVLGGGRLRAVLALQAERRSGGSVDGELRTFLKSKLPAVMVPEIFEVLDALPRLPHGKVDRRALSELDSPRRQPGTSARPRTPTELAIAGLWTRVLDVKQIGRHDSFFDLGGHSLLVPRLLLELHRAIGVALPVSTLFQAPTVAELATVIDGLVEQEGLADGEREMTVEQPVDLRAQVFLDSDIRPRKLALAPRAANEEPVAPATVFLTGATGFLGSFLLHELLRREAREVVCLARASGAEEAQSRIQRNLRRYGLWQRSSASRIVAVAGDLSRPFLGLSPAAFDELATRLDAIYHCGAWVNFTYPYRQLAPANVAGTRETLRLAARGRGTPYHFISTLSVTAATPPGKERVLREEGAGDRVEHLGSGYVRTKWVAEQLVRLAHGRGIPATVYRPGLIGGHSGGGVSNTRDMVWSQIKGFIQLGAAAPTSRYFNLAPVDYVSRAVVQLSRQAASAGQVFHLFNPRPSSWDDTLEVLTRMGYPLRKLAYREWRRKLLAELERGAENALEPFLPQLPTALDEATPEEPPRIDNQRTARALRGSGIECPPLDAELLRGYVESLIARGFLPAP